VLSGRTRNADDFSLLNDKYGVDLLPSNYHEDFIMKQLYESAAANQVRGSVNTPEPLMDVDEDYEEKMAEMVINGFIPETPESSAAPPKEKAAPVLLSPDKDEAIFSLLQRFQLIRRISKCVQYVAKTHARWGDAGSRTRRAMLVSRLTPAQRSEFADAFALVDTNKDGLIEWEELKRVVDVGALAGTKSGDLNEILEHPEQLDNNDENEADRITLEDCMGLMAEAEFYYLFRDIFAELDENDSGFVKARELDRVLSGVRDLISDDRKSVIDVEDKDMLIDYEQFSRMLLGTSLI
jgi:Ca2+-binding EF-hand superfamily protein